MATVKPVSRDSGALKTKRVILAAARRLLIARGYQDVVLDDVAKEAGVAKGTLFLHYKSKEDLFEAIFADLVEHLGLELDALAKTGVRGRDLLIATARVILQHFEHNRDFMAQFSTGRFPGCGARSSHRLMDRMKENVARVRGLLDAACADGTGPRDADFSAMAFLGLCRTATMRKVFEGLESPLERDAEAVVEFYLAGSGARP